MEQLALARNFRVALLRLQKSALILTLGMVALLANGFASAAMQSVDLTAYVNHDGESLTKNYTNLPRNIQLLSAGLGTPFIIEPNVNDDIFIVASAPVTIDFQAQAKAVHFIGQIHYGVPNNLIVGTYTINYSDLSSVTINLDSSNASPDWNIDDHCCNWRAQSLPKASLAWIDSTQSGKQTLLREFVWTNPQPHLMIENIEFASTGTNFVSPVLAAITYQAVPIPPAALLFSSALLALYRRKGISVCRIVLNRSLRPRPM